MTKNNVINHVNEQIKKLHFKMHKHKKRWIVIGMSTLALAGGVGSLAYNSASADHFIQQGGSIPKLNLPVFKTPSINQIKLNDRVDRSAVAVSYNNNPKPIRHAITFPNWGHNGADEPLSYDQGSPNHFGREIPDFDSTHAFASYRRGYHLTNSRGIFDIVNLGEFHGGETRQDLQMGRHGGGSVWEAKLNPNKPPRQVTAEYQNGATIAVPHKDKDGNTYYRRQKVNVVLKATDINYYKPWRGNHSIVFSRNLSRGIWYNGISSMKINYSFVNGKTGKTIPSLDNAYMRFKRVDAISSVGYSRGYTQDDSTNNESRTNAIDGTRYVPIVGSGGSKDKTGEFVFPAPNTGKPYVGSKTSTIRRYFSRILNMPVIGGYKGTGGTGSDRDIYIQMKQNNVTITAGSGSGYGSFVPETEIKLRKPPKRKRKKRHHNPKPKPGSHSTPIKKSIIGLKQTTVNDDTIGKITHRNQDFKYKLDGEVPHRSAKNTYVLHHHHKVVEHDNWSYEWEDMPYFTGETDDNGFPLEYDHWEKMPVNHPTYETIHWTTKSRLFDGHPNDHYNLVDNLPKEVHIKGGISGIENASSLPSGTVHVDTASDGHQVVHLDLDNHDMDTATKNHHRKFSLIVPVSASNLPKDSQMTKDGGDFNADDNANEVSDYNSNGYFSGKARTHTGSNLPKHGNTDQLNEDSGSANSNDNNSYWYRFWNGDVANSADDVTHTGPTEAKEQVYKNVAERYSSAYWDDPKSTKESNSVGAEIRKMNYHVVHYDYGSSDNAFVPNSWFPNGHNDQDYDDNEDVDDLSTYSGWGFEGDTIPVKTLSRHNGNEASTEYDNNSSNETAQADYRFAYGDDDWVFPKLTYKNDNGHSSADSSTVTKDNDDYDESFYKPYVLPHAKFAQTGRFMVDTDKASNKLPFRLDLKTATMLFRHGDLKYEDFKGIRVNITVTSRKSGRALYTTSEPMSDLFNSMYGDHKTKYFTKSGMLDTTGENVKSGDKLPLHVEVGFSDPDNTGAELEGLSTNSNAWIASQHDLKGKDFHGSNKDTASVKAPERTIKYFSEDENADPRTQFEEFDMNQNHKQATAKTGLGIRSNLSMSYFGHINAGNYGKYGTDTDYAFPSSWDSSDTDIKYASNPYHDAISNGVSPNGMSMSDMEKADKDNREHGSIGSDYSSYNKDDLADRLEHANHNYEKANNSSAVKDKLASLDSINTKDNRASATEHDTDSEFASHLPDVKSDGNLTSDDAGRYTTDFKFYPRLIVRNSGDALIGTSNDPFAKNKGLSGIDSTINIDNIFNHPTNDNSISTNTNRFYTPFWLPLGYYNTSFNKAMPSSNSVGGFSGHVGTHNSSNWKDTKDDARLGGNYFNYEDNMFDQMTGHEYLADGSKSENNDEISIQPVLGGSNDQNGKNTNGQTVDGFSNHANAWVQFKDNWKSFFGL